MAGIRVGVDVGGTNTDAVVMAGRRLLGWAKTPTTADVTGGIVERRPRGAGPRRDRAVRCPGRHDRHDPLHQRRRRAAAPGADGHRAARAAGHGLGAAVRGLAGRPPSRDRRPRLPGARRLRVRRPGDRAARRGRATRHRRPDPAARRHGPRDLRRLQPDPPGPRTAGGGDPPGGPPRCPDQPLARDRPPRAAGARERLHPERLPERAGRHDGDRHRERAPGACAGRGRLPLPERRHVDVGRVRPPLPGPDLRQRPHQLDARRGVPLRPARRRRDRRRRHDLGRRRAGGRLPARGEPGGRGRRRPHQLPDAGPADARARRRQPASDRAPPARRPPSARTASATGSRSGRSSSAAPT